MKNLIIILFLILNTNVFAQQYSRVKIYTDESGLQKLALLGVALDHGETKKGIFFISDFSETEISIMKENGYSYDVLILDVKKHYRNQNKTLEKSIEKNNSCNDSNNSFIPKTPLNFQLGSMGGFYTYQEFLDEIDLMAIKYPNLISLKSPISTFLTVENRPIYWLKISDNPLIDELNESEVLYTGLHHAREPISLTEVVFYMWYLLENYELNEEVKFLVDNTELFFIPCLNPDGYVYNETTDPTGGGMHRKNRRNVGATNKGVDLNRNYSYSWGTTGISLNLDSDIYPGTSPFSEVETQAVKWFCENRNFTFASNAHSYGDHILYPISSSTSEQALDKDYFAAYSNEMVRDNHFGNMKSSDIYAASGESDDFMYKDDLINKPQIFPVTPEIGNSSHGFWPASSIITELCKDMIYSNLMIAQLTHLYVVVNESDPSYLNSVNGKFHYSVYRLGSETGNVTVSIEPLQGIQSVGNGMIYNLNLREYREDSISFTLNPNLEFGATIQYILKTDYGSWIKRDTIIKKFGDITLQYFDDATSITGWTGNWGITNVSNHPYSNSFTDSPFGNYSIGSQNVFQLNQTLDLRYSASPMISFFAKWDIESDYDYCQFQVSEDNGVNWVSQCGLFTVPGSAFSTGGSQPSGEPVYEGSQLSWVREEIDLSNYLDKVVKVRFLLKSDNGIQKDGFYFDDFKVLYNYDSNAKLDINEFDLGLKLVPNPSNQSLVINFSNKINNGQLEIKDQSGKIIFTKIIEESLNKITIETDKFTSGVYFVSLGNTNTKPMKMVVIH